MAITTFSPVTAAVLVVLTTIAALPVAGVDADAADSFEQTYALEQGRSLRRVLPPFHADRLDFLRNQGVTEERAGHLAAAMVVRWRDGRPSIWGRKSATVPWYTLGDLVGHFVGVARWELEGDRQLIDLPLPGDFVVDRRASAEQYRAAIERIATDVAGRQLTLEFREVERPVLVLKGRWRYTPVAERRGRDELPTLELYEGPELTRPPEEGGEAAGNIDEAAGAISQFLGRRVLVECEGAPLRVQVRRDDFAPGTPEAKAKLDETLVLRRLEAQTALTAVEEPTQGAAAVRDAARNGRSPTSVVKRHLLSCGYYLHATPERCPECGTMRQSTEAPSVQCPLPRRARDRSFPSPRPLGFRGRQEVLAVEGPERGTNSLVQ